MSGAQNRGSRPFEPDQRLMYGWRYWRTGRFSWYGYVGGWQPGFLAFTEKRMRNKIARFIRKQRASDLSRRQSTRTS